MTNGARQNFDQLPERGASATDIRSASQAPEAGVAVRDAAPSAAPDFVEITSEDGLAIVVAKASIALVREAPVSLGSTKAIIILQSGAVVPTATAFDEIVKRINQLNLER